MDYDMVEPMQNYATDVAPKSVRKNMEDFGANARCNTPNVDSRIHLNAAGCSLPSCKTVDKVNLYLEQERTLGAYELASSSPDLHAPYKELAQLLGCQEDEIAVVTSATEAFHQIIWGLAWRWHGQTDACHKNIVTCPAEYGSNYLTYLQIRRRLGIGIIVAPENEQGDLCMMSLEKILADNHVELISIPHVPTSSGKVYDAEAIGTLAKKYHAMYLLDACQSVGQIVVDVKKIGCDFLTGTSRKFIRGMRGSGFLFCSRDVAHKFEPSSIDVHSAVWTSRDCYELGRRMSRFEKYEMSFASKVALGNAVKELNAIGIEHVEQRICGLADYLRRKLRETLGDKVLLQDVGSRLCGIVSFSPLSAPVAVVFEALQKAHISVSLSKRTSTRLDFEARNINEVIRASVHVYNTISELDRFVGELDRILVGINRKPPC